MPPGTQIEGLQGERLDLTEPGRRAVVARGGAGGHGNKHFATSTRQTPRFAERGLPGESGWVELRLKLLADAGLVGLPNIGKSSLLGRLTRAAPKVAGYPFTTLEPVLGTIDDGERQLILADIPEPDCGAAHGAGLGRRSSPMWSAAGSRPPDRSRPGRGATRSSATRPCAASSRHTAPALMFAEIVVISSAT